MINVLESPISRHLIFEATYRRDDRFPFIQLRRLVRQVCECVVYGIHAIYDAGKNNRPSLDHGLIAVNWSKHKDIRKHARAAHVYVNQLTRN